MGGKYNYNTYPSPNAKASNTGTAMTETYPLHLSSRQLDIWNNISGKLHSASEIELFLDYDGTITPIRSTPEEALLSPDTIHLLERLIQLPGLRLTIVTGRSMKDIRRLIPFENIGFIANHGFHIYQNREEWIHPDAVSTHQTLHQLHTILQTVLNKFKNAYLEDKQFTLSLHYRNVSIQDQIIFKEMARKTIWEFDPKLVITEGKEVLEVRPPVDWGKGYAVMEILKMPQHDTHALQMYIGDDTTDEHAFQVLQQSAITIHVGKTSRTFAQYYVNDVDEVLQILKMIITLRSHRANHHPT
jgi:trehalose 6-phosphate phosphatase